MCCSTPQLPAPQQLCTRLHLSVPYMGRGIGDPCTESSIKEGVDTSSRRQCNTLAGIHLPHQYTPLVPCVGNEIQDPTHIVPEANRADWVRGGYPSRQWVRNVKSPCYSGAKPAEPRAFAGENQHQL